MAILLEHVKSLKSFLEAVPEAKRKDACVKQVKNLKAKIDSSSVSVPDCTELMRAINRMPLENAQMDVLCTAILEKASASKGTSTRRDNQCWEQCWKKIPQQVWDSWNPEGKQASEIIEKMIIFFHSKGLRLPSETSVGCFVALCLAVTSDKDASKARKLALVWDVKRMWTSMFRRPLPVTTWYHFYDEVPFPADTSMAKFDHREMLELWDSIPLRSSNSCVQLHKSKPEPMHLQLQNQGRASELQSITEVFGAALKQMHDTQLMTLQAIQGGQHQSLMLGRSQSFHAGAKRNSLTLGGTYVGTNNDGSKQLQPGRPMQLQLQGSGVTTLSRVSAANSSSAAALALHDGMPEQAELLAHEVPDGDEAEMEEQVRQQGESAKEQSEVSVRQASGRMSLAHATAMLLGGGKVKSEKAASCTAEAAPSQKAAACKGKGNKGKKNKKRKASRSAGVLPVLPAEEPSTPPKLGNAAKDTTPSARRVSIATPKAKAKAASSPKATTAKKTASQKVGPKPSPAEKAAATTVELKTKLWVKYGCSKCRYKAGCSTSCWTYRGMLRPTVR